MISRRGFLQGTAGMAAMTMLSGRISAEEPRGEIALPELGRLRPLHAREIKASPLSIGFETLDRRLFDPTRTYEHLGKLGVKWARAQTGWSRCETTKGRYDFGWLDEVVDSLADQGIQAWFNLGYGNKLYTPEAPDVSAVGFAPIFSEEARKGWSAFVTALARHFADRVKYWEIWNEPNINIFWRPKEPDAASYAELVKLTAPIIRQHIPAATIIGGALALCDVNYTTACLKAGLADHIDRLSFHPYGPLPENDESSVAAVRKELGQRQSKIKLWQGECGCPSDPKTENGTDVRGRKWDETRQAKWLLRRVLTDLRQELDLTSYFTAVDLTRYNWGNGSTSHAQSYGVLRGTDYSPKPSYYAYQSLCSLFDARTKRDRTLKLVREGDADDAFVTAEFARDGRPLCVYWLATDLLDAFQPKTGSWRLPAPANATIENPVLIDPLSQRIYDLKDAVTHREGLALAGLPLLDYPLIITDRSVAPST